MVTAEVPTGRRERKKLATRQALHQAARQLVAERGLAAVTVEAIAARADVATRTFFNHFSSKEDAVLGMDPARADQLAADLREALGAGMAPIDALEAAMQASMEREAVDSASLGERMALLRREPLLLSASFHHWELLTEAAVAVIAETTGPGPYPELVVAVAVAAARSAMHAWADVPGSDLSAAVHAAFDSVRAGLPSPSRSEHP